MYHKRGGRGAGGLLVVFLSFRKNKETISWNFKKNSKGLPFHCQKCVDQKYLWRSRNYWEPLKSIIRFLTIAIWNLDKGKRQNLKNSNSDGPLIVNQTFFQKLNTLFRFCIYYAFSLNQMPDNCEVWKYWLLKYGWFCLFSQKSYRAAILWCVLFQKTSNF